MILSVQSKTNLSFKGVDNFKSFKVPKMPLEKIAAGEAAKDSFNLLKNKSQNDKKSDSVAALNNQTSFKSRQIDYKDPLKAYPAKCLAYSNELGAVISGISPKIGTALWAPALMYFGADIYDKYKNDNNSYSPSGKRGVKEAVFQALASVFLPTSAVAIGQRIASSLNRIGKTGLSSQSKIDILDKSLTFMQSKSLHTYEADAQKYAQEFSEAILNSTRDSKGDFKAMPFYKKVLAVLNLKKDSDSLAFAKEQKVANFAQNHAQKLILMREQLMQNQRPKEMSKKMFEKFKNIQGDYAKIYPADKYPGKAAKSILKDYHQSEILKNKMIKTLGGFAALVLLAKPIDDFVENIVIKKTVEPGMDYISQGYYNTKATYQQNKQRKSGQNGASLSASD